jgi:phage gp29-like protein
LTKDAAQAHDPGGIDGNGVDEPLPPFKFIYAQIKAKSGLPLRSGLVRQVAWAWMFKAFTQRDWAIFTQTYGQPVRVGKYHEGASREDKATLMRAVANIAGDCAAIIPASMTMEFIEAKNVSAGSDLYERRANWLDQQVSKAVLGQTATTDAIAGGHAVGQEHRQVQEDIEAADCKALQAILNRDLIRPWMDLNFGPSKRYPRIIIARPQREDLKQLTDSLAQLVPLGLKVQQSEVRDKLGLAEPAPGSDTLQAQPAQPAARTWRRSLRHNRRSPAPRRSRPIRIRPI